MPVETGAEFRIIPVTGRGARLDHDIHRRPALALAAETLAHRALDTRAIDRPSHRFLGHRQAETRHIRPAAAGQHHEAGVAAARAVAEHMAEFRGLEQAHRPGEGSGTHGPGCRCYTLTLRRLRPF